jgi:hypothetical protein
MLIDPFAGCQNFLIWHCVGAKAELVVIPELLSMFLCHELICWHHTIIWNSIDHRYVRLQGIICVMNAALVVFIIYVLCLHISAV